MARSVLPPALAACAAVPLAVAAPAPPPVAAQEPVMVQSCVTTTLTNAEIAAGEHSDITCTWVDETQQRLRTSRSDYIATHWSGNGGYGNSLSVGGGACQGGISFSAGSAWNDRISSTTHYVCGTIKHFANNDYTGGPETTDGPAWVALTLTGFLNDQVSSVAYG